MKLYEIRFRFYAPKDSKEGILTYLLAESSEDVYEWIRSEPKLQNDKHIFVSWMYKDDPEADEYEKDFKNRIIECCGDMYDDESEVYDLYYGATQYGWKEVSSNVSSNITYELKRLGIPAEEIV
ncbi:MAG TPA: hypothetical protein GXZ90_05125 [Clostridiales bacterium]|nr:hypothetical protein [Clostridiales bacterium]